ncbi:MAG: KH domain-containing protein [Firmicutes bacterium]|nr:KH domain-containing protein [Bacillota bacterium]
MRDLLEMMAKSLADHKEDILIEERSEGGVVDLTLKVNPEDMGKVIGKQGRIANSMRQILKACAIKENVKVSLEIASLDE